MNKETIQLRRLGESDTVRGFDCGDNDLNEFITTDAPLYYRVRLATSYVLEDGESGDVIGHFSLAHDRISLTDFPSMVLLLFRKKTMEPKHGCFTSIWKH